MMLSPFPWIDFPEPRCPQSPVSASPRLRTTLDLRDFRGGKPSTSYRRLTQIRIDNLVSLKKSNFFAGRVEGVHQTGEGAIEFEGREYDSLHSTLARILSATEAD